MRDSRLFLTFKRLQKNFRFSRQILYNIVYVVYKQIILLEISLITKNITTWLVNKGLSTGNDGIYIVWSS